MENNSVKIWEEQVVIPTYLTSQPDKNPLFFEKRVYQGSSGKVYPHAVTEKIYDEKQDIDYQAVFLENQFLKVMILPELGGRIQRAYDKTNDYDFVYYNHVIKPALVGLTGPWISGGIEFNWPQHHRPSTFMPTEYRITSGQDGSQTLWVSEIDKMYGTKGLVGFTLYPDKSYIEITGKVYNRTDIPQTFLWWANPAVPVNDQTYSVFPPDVRAVMDHGKRAVSTFPIATGTYYKYDYSEGIDISMYKNIKVPTSYMAHHSDYDFIGNYDEGIQAGLLHVADHHVSPGKKQWTWGNSDFGQAWDRNLTDEDGPYIELMTGVFTDNQPDFTWLKPYEEKTFTQYFMPYKGVGRVKNATIDAAVNLELDGCEVVVTVYVTAPQNKLRIQLLDDTICYLDEEQNLSPDSYYEKRIESKLEVLPEKMTLLVSDNKGQVLVTYQVPVETLTAVPDPAEELAKPEKLKSTEELFLAATHLEQHRHATLNPEDYYLEGLRRDPQDIRLNNGYGMYLYRQGLFLESEKHFRTAVTKQTWKSPNPYYGEPLFNLGLSLKMQGKLDEAYDYFYKATWNDDTQSSAWYQLATLESRQENWEKALEFIEKSLVKNQHHLKARHLKAALLRKTGKDSTQLLAATLEIDPLDLGSHFENYLLHGTDTVFKLLRGEINNYLELSLDYYDFSLIEEADQVLQKYHGEQPLIGYYRAFYHYQLGDTKTADRLIIEAEDYLPDYCFPNKLYELMILEWVIQRNPQAGFGHYYLGNLLYDKKRYDQGIALWEKASELLPNFAIVHRNLSFAYYNKRDDSQAALNKIQAAVTCDPKDARILMEQDQLLTKLGYSLNDREALLMKEPETLKFRDDLYVEYISLLNSLGKHQKAYDAIMSRQFHPWEGGEGKISGQFEYALVELAKEKLLIEPEQALELLEEALIYPTNLGEGKLPNKQDTIIFYYLARAHEQLGHLVEMNKYDELATAVKQQPESVLYYNDQPADSILYQGLSFEKQGKEQLASACYNQLIAYGERHLFDEISYDYFAVSLPSTVMFKEDLERTNQQYCRYLIALGLVGQKEYNKAEEIMKEILDQQPDYQGALRHLHLLQELRTTRA